MVRKVKKRTISLALIALLVLTGALMTTGTAAPRPVMRLATPQLVSPRNGATLSSIPFYYDFECRAVNGVDYYQIELQYATLVGKNSIEWTSGGTWGSDDPTWTLGFNKVALWRWRVMAIATDPLLNSYPSKWRTFTVVE